MFCGPTASGTCKPVSDSRPAQVFCCPCEAAAILSTATEEDVAAVYPTEVYNRLAAVKRQYDPGNLFARNHNVRPR